MTHFSASRALVVALTYIPLLCAADSALVRDEGMHIISEEGYFDCSNPTVVGALARADLIESLQRLIIEKAESNNNNPCYVELVRMIHMVTVEERRVDYILYKGGYLPADLHSDSNYFLVPLLSYILMSNYFSEQKYSGLRLLIEQPWANPNDLSVGGYALIHTAVHLRNAVLLAQVLQLPSINLNLPDIKGNTPLQLTAMMDTKNLKKYKKYYSAGNQFADLVSSGLHSMHAVANSRDLAQLLREAGAIE